MSGYKTRGDENSQDGGGEEGEDHETPILQGFPKDFQRISMDFKDIVIELRGFEWLNKGPLMVGYGRPGSVTTSKWILGIL